MWHPSRGVLRLLIDEPALVPDQTRSHVDACLPCQQALDRLRASASPASWLAELQPDPADVAGRLGVLRAAATTAGGPRLAPASAGRAWNRRVGGTVMAVAAAALLATTVVVTGAWSNLLTIFYPVSVQPVILQDNDFVGLPDLSAYGQVDPPRFDYKEVASAAEAKRLTGLDPAVPASLPPGTPGQVRYFVMSATSWQFTFSSERAAATVARTGRPLPPLPANIDHSTLVVNAGPAVMTVYGDLGQAGRKSMDPASTSGAGPVPKPRRDASDGPGPASTTGTPPPDQLGSLAAGGPGLVTLAAGVPRVQSTGVTVQQLEDFFLQLPGVSADLKRQIQGLGNPTNTLPIPISAEAARQLNPTPFTVQGTRGLFLGDNALQVGILIWIKGNRVLALGGTFSQAQLLAAANSLR